MAGMYPREIPSCTYPVSQKFSLDICCVPLVVFFSLHLQVMTVANVFPFITCSLSLQPATLLVGTAFETHSFWKIAKTQCNRLQVTIYDIFHWSNI